MSSARQYLAKGRGIVCVEAVPTANSKEAAIVLVD